VARVTPLTTPFEASAVLFKHLESQKGYWIVEQPSEFQDLLRSLNFRDELIPKATYSSDVLPHRDARQWVERFAQGMYVRHV